MSIVTCRQVKDLPPHLREFFMKVHDDLRVWAAEYPEEDVGYGHFDDVVVRYDRDLDGLYASIEWHTWMITVPREDCACWQDDDLTSCVCDTDSLPAEDSYELMLSTNTPIAESSRIRLFLEETLADRHRG